MELVDNGIVLGARAHGETHSVVEIFTQSHGRWAGLIYGGQGRKMQPLLQAGNSVRAEWKGRLAESLGHFTLELTNARAGALLQDRFSLAGLSAACVMASVCLPEREAHAPSYEAMMVLLDNLDAPDLWPALMARWELGLLAELGFGLTVDKCVATGSRDHLIYISPKSAGAVCAEAGEPHKEKLLPLPAFMRGGASEATTAEALDALKTTGYFIETRILHLADKQLPEARLRVMELLNATLQSVANEG